MKPITRQSFRPVTAGIVFCVVVGAVLLLSVVFSAALPKDVMQWCYAFVAPFLYIVAVFVGGRADGTDVPAAVGLKRAPKPWQALLTVALAFVCVLAFLPLAEGVQWVFARMGYHATPDYADYSSSWDRMVLGLFGLALLPALGEEMLCRGMMFGAMKEKGTFYAVFMSALLFALWHGSPIQLVHQFLIGAVMAVLVHFTRTVWTSVIFHFCNNAIVILYEFAYIQRGWTYTIPWWVYLIMAAVGIPAVCLLLWLFVRRTVKSVERERGALSFSDEHPTASERVRRAFDVYGEYTPYVKGQNMIAVYAAFGVVAILWIIGTVSGWIAS